MIGAMIYSVAIVNYKTLLSFGLKIKEQVKNELCEAYVISLCGPLGNQP